MRLRFFRRIGLFEATVYLEHKFLDEKHPNPSPILNATSTVHVFGEFSPEQPWQVYIPCKYDPGLNCFKADIVIRIG